ncbi:MAG TPA: DUF3313 family protein [Gammaproteobacteria bacterium]
MERKHLIFSLIACVMTVSAGRAADDPELTHDGLMPIEDTRADAVYVLPEADFAAYNSFIVLEPYVAFRRNWQRDVNRAARGTSGRVSDDDMEQIKSDVAELFREVFVEQLESGGFTVVDEPGEDVMILRPAILNLDITAPDVGSPGRDRTYVTQAGSASLFIELYDSVTGQILARAVDSRRARNSPTFQWATSVSNRAEARRVLNTWAGMLVERLNEVREHEEPDDAG